MSARFAVDDALIPGHWLTALREPWPIAAVAALAEHPLIVRVTIATKRGSAPRDAGTSMLIMPSQLIGTIGGGHLEWQALRIARDLLDDAQTPPVHLQRMILGQDLAQCCGGEVQLWFERLTRDDLSWLRRLSILIKDNDTPVLATQRVGRDIKRLLLRPGMPQYPANHFISGVQLTRDNDNDEITLIERLNARRPSLWLYGAGHVGQALVRLLADVALDITWIDTRPELLPGDVPSNVRIKTGSNLLELARCAPATAHHRIMTHDHGLDYLLCRELLDGDFASLGVIGSNSKAVRFRSQLKRDGVAPERVANLLCPIGMDMANKEPAIIALGIATQLLQQSNGAQSVTEAYVETNTGTVTASEIYIDACTGKDCATCRERSAT